MESAIASPIADVATPSFSLSTPTLTPTQPRTHIPPPMTPMLFLSTEFDLLPVLNPMTSVDSALKSFTAHRLSQLPFLNLFCSQSRFSSKVPPKLRPL